MAATSLVANFRRSEFIGRTDKYSPPSGFLTPDLDKAFRGAKPLDVSGAVLSDSYVGDAITRLANYRNLWNFYSGKHFSVDMVGGVEKRAFNFCRKIVDKRASWITGKGFSFYSEKGNELVSDVLDRVWRANQKKILVRRTAKTSLTTGDAFWFFTLKTKDSAGRALPPEKHHIVITPINPAYCHPIWSENNPQELQCFMMQFPVQESTSSQYLFTAVMTAEQVTTYKNTEAVSVMSNALGLIPVVHIPNSPVGEASFGHSCLDDVIPLNKEYNEVNESVGRIIRYHGEPTTLVFGSRLADMERGANKVWSNLPPPDQCAVMNLEMKSDLAATYSRLEGLESQMYHLGRTPKFCFDSEGMSISNTSGMAMQLLYLPLIEATMEEQDIYSLAIQRGNQIIAAMHKTYFGEDLTLLADNPETALDMDVCWQSLLPKDEQLEVDLMEKKLAMGIISKAEVSRRLSGVKDTAKLALEIAADDRYEIALAAEKARALAQQPPNYSATMLSSMFLSEDLLPVAKKIAELDDSEGFSAEDRDEE